MAGKVTPLEKPQQPKAQEDVLVSYDTSAIWSRSGVDGTRYNPDDLVGKKGLGIYGTMLVDDQVKSATEFKLASILARGYEFCFENGTKLSKEQQQERIAVCNQIIERMTGTFDTAIENIASGREYGYSVTEKVLSSIDVEGRTYTGISRLVLRDPASFSFKADDYGLNKTSWQAAGRGLQLQIDNDKLIHYVHKPKWDEFYGRSELRAAYKWWFIKDQVSKLWPMYLEKFAGGIGVATRVQGSNASTNAADVAAFKTALTNMRALSSIMVPEGWDLTLNFPATTDAYEKCITACDLAIARSQLVPNLLGASHTGQTGSYSQSQTQFEAYLWTVKLDGNAIAECLNEQLFRQLFDLNWGDYEYPWFRFKPASFEHVKWMLTTWKDMLGVGAVIESEEDERYIRKLLEMPSREPDEILRNPVEEQQQAADRQHQLDMIDAKASQTQQALSASFQRLETELVAKLTTQPPVNVTVNAPVDASSEHHLNSASAQSNGTYPQAFDRATERVNLSVVEQRTQAIEKVHVAELATIIAKATKRALGNDEQLSQLMHAEPAAVAAFDLSAADRGKLRNAARELLNESWRLGSDMASNEMDRARKQTTELSSRKVKLASLLDNAVAYFDAQSFRMAGDASDQTRKIIQQQLQNGIKFGKTLTDVRSEIWDALVVKGLISQEIVRGIETDAAINQALDALWVDTEEQATAYLNTLVRTNTFEAFNEARFAEFTDPELSDFVLALRYSAVMDSSTTEICKGLHDHVYKASSELWNKYRPPNHFNCRSVLIPITAIDGWDGQESELPDVEPQEGFK